MLFAHFLVTASLCAFLITVVLLKEVSSDFLPAVILLGVKLEF